jgi:hypothetical protein
MTQGLRRPGRLRAHESWIFAVLLVWYIGYVLVCMLADPRAARPWDVVVPTAVLGSAYWGVGVWIWVGLRRDRRRIAAICWAGFTVVGVMVSLGVTAAGLNKGAHRIIFAWDLLYLLWALLALGVLGAGTWVKPDVNGTGPDGCREALPEYPQAGHEERTGAPEQQRRGLP